MESTTSAQAMEATPLIMVVAMQATHTPATTATLTPMMEAATPTHTSVILCVYIKKGRPRMLRLN